MSSAMDLANKSFCTWTCLNILFATVKYRLNMGIKLCPKWRWIQCLHHFWFWTWKLDINRMRNRLNGPSNPKNGTTGSILHTYAIKQTHEDTEVEKIRLLTKNYKVRVHPMNNKGWPSLSSLRTYSFPSAAFRNCQCMSVYKLLDNECSN